MAEDDPSYQLKIIPHSTPDQSHSKMIQDDWERVRATEYPQLKGSVYLDHAGTTLYAQSLVDAVSNDMKTTLYGNPHSASSPSAISGQKVDSIRVQALQFFNANPLHWDLVFVPNATGAIKLVVECFRDHAAAEHRRWWYGYHKDAHTSLVGARDVADLHHCFSSDDEVERWIRSGCKTRTWGRRRPLGLFAYPGQSNMTGRRLPLEWCARVRESSASASTSASCRVHTLLDAAALAMTCPLNLEDPRASPDFVALSFYKIFGSPNLGALLVQKRCGHVLQSRKYFGGGTVDMVISVGDTWQAKKQESIHDRLEDGTLPFHSIFALGHALNVHQTLYGNLPMSRICQRVSVLVESLYLQLSQLRHANGRPVVQIYNDEKSKYGDAQTQGATIALNIWRADGSVVGYADAEKEASKANIFLRSGSLCNPGGLATYLDWSPEQMRYAYAAGHRCGAPVQSVLEKPTGVLRISLGAMSTKSDIDALVEFVTSTYQDTAHVEKQDDLDVESSSVDKSLEVKVAFGAPKWSFTMRRLLSCLDD